MSDPAALEDAVLLPTYARWGLSIVKGRGVHVEDDQGRRFLDLYGGHAVASTGHCHPAVVEAIREAAGELLFYSTVAHHPTRAEAARRLVAAASPEIDRVFFVNSGAEANESAIRITRRITGRSTVVSFEGGFHGRTLAALSATGIAAYHQGIGPLAPGHTILPWADEASLETIDTTVAAVLLEPIQSMAGARVAPPSWLAALRKRCNEVGALLVLDEVQTGAGRAGTFFSHGWSGVEGDLLTCAKGIASGFPVGAVLTRENLAEQLAPGDLGSTFGGGPVAMAACAATARVIEEEELAGNASRMETVLREGLAAFGQVVETVGRGLLLGVRLDGLPAREAVVRFRSAGILLGTSNDPAVLRLLPPLVLTPDDLHPFWKACQSILD